MAAQIKIDKTVEKVDKTYRVYVSHTSYYFKSERAAKDFLRATDNYLNEQFELINANLITTYGTYRRLSSYIHTYDRQAIRLQINSIEEAIELSRDRADWPNYRTFIFDNLAYCIDTLTGIQERMQQISKRKKYTVLAGEIRAGLNASKLQLAAAISFDFKNKKYSSKAPQIINITRKIKFN
jgi:hypothetical protein